MLLTYPWRRFVTNDGTVFQYRKLCRVFIVSVLYRDFPTVTRLWTVARLISAIRRHNATQ